MMNKFSIIALALALALANTSTGLAQTANANAECSQRSTLSVNEQLTTNNACANREQKSSLIMPRCSQGSTLSVNEQLKANAKAKAKANVMPEVIDSVKAPFEICQFVRNIFPNYSVSITETGAKHGKKSTSAIQKAIDKVAKNGGGRVVVPEGEWLTGRLILKSNIDLHLEKGARLHFSGAVKDYLPVVETRDEGLDLYSLGAFIYANGQDNIGLTGEGTLVAPSRDCEICQRQIINVEEDIINTPLEKRIFDGKHKAKIYMPVFFGPINCTNVLVEGVTFEKSIFWNVCPTYCKNIIIRGITVNAVGQGRTDGIDIDSSVNSLIEYCTLDCGDDCFTLKSGRNTDGLLRNRPTENVIIRHCRVINGSGGITIGSETAAMVRNVYAYDVTMETPSRGFYFKSRRSRGGGGENCWFEDIHIKAPKAAAFTWDMLGSSKYVGDLAKRFPQREITPLTPVFRNMYFKNITVDTCTQLITASGLPESPITNIQMENINANNNKIISMQDVDVSTCKFDIR